MADKVHIPREAPGPAGEPSSGKGAPQFGLTAAMALIVGSIIGVGVFNLPTSLAVCGPITLVAARELPSAMPPGVSRGVSCRGAPGGRTDARRAAQSPGHG